MFPGNSFGVGRREIAPTQWNARLQPLQQVFCLNKEVPAAFFRECHLRLTQLFTVGLLSIHLLPVSGRISSDRVTPFHQKELAHVI